MRARSQIDVKCLIWWRFLWCSYVNLVCYSWISRLRKNIIDVYSRQGISELPSLVITLSRFSESRCVSVLSYCYDISSYASKSYFYEVSVLSRYMNFEFYKSLQVKLIMIYWCNKVGYEIAPTAFCLIQTVPLEYCLLIGTISLSMFFSAYNDAAGSCVVNPTPPNNITYRACMADMKPVCFIQLHKRFHSIAPMRNIFFLVPNGLYITFNGPARPAR